MRLRPECTNGDSRFKKIRETQNFDLRKPTGIGYRAKMWGHKLILEMTVSQNTHSENWHDFRSTLD